MPQKPTLQNTNPNTQAAHRFVDTYLDIHKSARFPGGRPFWGYREYAANPELGHQPGFVSADLMPGNHEEPLTSGWIAPWLPEARYFRFNDNRKQISFAYEVMERDELSALERYWEAAAVVSGERGWEEVDPAKPLSFQVRTIIGRAPRMLRIAQAARAGDPWLLGHIDEPNDELAAILNYRVVRFGGRHESGFAIGTPVVGRVPEPAPPLTPEQVLSANPAALASLIADIVNATMDAREQVKRERTQKARSARSANRKSSQAESDAA